MKDPSHTKNAQSVSAAHNIQIIKKPQSRIHKSNLSHATKELSRIELQQNLQSNNTQIISSQTGNNTTDISARKNG